MEERERKGGREAEGRERERGRKGKLVNVFLSACFYESLR